MGKVVGLVGAASGKIGNIVYAVTNGIQTARVYQPVVSNPKSSKQSRQRAKGNLAGRISGFVPRTAIAGLGANNRIRRGEFLRNILKNSTVITSTDGVYEANIQPEEVVFSKGAVLLPVTFSNMTAIAHSIAVVLSGIADTIISADVYSSRLVRLVAMVYDSNNNLVEVSTKLATMPEQGATSTTIMPVIQSGSYHAFVYAIPMSTEDGSAVAVDTSAVSLDDDEIAASLSVNGNAVVFSYGRSVYLGEGNFTTA